MRKKEKWEELVTFLKEEISVREAYVLKEKSKKSVECEKRDEKDPKDSKDPKDACQSRQSSVFNSDASKTPVTPKPPDNPKCHIWGKFDGHVVKIGGVGKSCIEYISCKTIVK